MNHGWGISLRRLMSFFADDDRTLRLLQDRQARVTVRERDRQGFYVVPLKPSTDINASGCRLNIRVQYFDDGNLHFVVRDVAGRKTIMDLTTPVDKGAGMLNVEFQNLYLRVDFDPAREQT